MKCPKCGYVSFNYLDHCKNCGKNLTGFKKEKGIWGIKPGNRISLHREAAQFLSLDLSAPDATTTTQPAAPEGVDLEGSLATEPEEPSLSTTGSEGEEVGAEREKDGVEAEEEPLIILDEEEGDLSSDGEEDRLELIIDEDEEDEK